MTMKREFRDELGYIAPPNRKLPPVPGAGNSNYNTCEKLIRGKFHFPQIPSMGICNHILALFARYMVRV